MSAQAETALFGGKTIKIIVGMPPGGGVDSYARLVQRHLGRFLSGRPGIVVQNMPGVVERRSAFATVGMAARFRRLDLEPSIEAIL